MGWPLVGGLFVFTTMTLVLGELGEHIANGEPLTLVDTNFSNWLDAHRTPALVIIVRIATELGSTWLGVCASSILGLYLIRRRQTYWLAAVWLSVFGGMGLNRFLKYVFHRARPSFDDPILSLTGYSFPSGHTMTATVLWGVLAAYLISRTDRFFVRVLVFLSAAVLIAIVGFSRIYLGAHYLSDVLAAIAEGLAWLSLCFTLVYSFWHKRNYRPV